MHELNIVEADTLVLFIDNINVKFLVANSVTKERMKHVEIDSHFIHDLVMKNELDVRYTSTKDQIENIMTNPLGETQFVPFKIKLMVFPPP